VFMKIFIHHNNGSINKTEKKWLSVSFSDVASAATADHKPNRRHQKQFTVINYGRNDAMSQVADDVDDYDDVVTVAPRRSAVQVHHGPPATAGRFSSPHRPHSAVAERGSCGTQLSVLNVEDELRVRCAGPRQTLANGRRAVGRHYSGGHCIPPAVPNGGPPTTTTVARKRHRSDDRHDSVIIDLLTEPIIPERNTASDSSKADAGDAETLVPAAATVQKSPSADDRRSSGFTVVSSSESVVDSFRRTVDVARLPEVARRGRLFAKRYRRRLVLQSGVCNVSFANVDRRGARLLMDIFTTLLEMKWRYGTVHLKPGFHYPS